MSKLNLSSSLFIGLIALLATSCVSNKKYEELLTEKNSYQDEVASMQTIQEEAQISRQKYRETDIQLRQSILENEDLTIQVQRLQTEHNDLLQRYDQLLQQNKALLSTASYERQALIEQMSAQQEELDQKKQEAGQYQYNTAEQQAYLDQLQQSLEAREMRINELEAALVAKDSQMVMLRSQITQSLTGYGSNDLAVTERDGKLYVTLSQGLIFKKGSAKVDSRGKQVLQQLSSVLSANSGFDITVEGHTDSDGSAKKNWELSTTRANSVVQILLQNGVTAERITAAGRAFYDPVAPNDTPSNKAKNRRTEIILSPPLDDLYNLMGQSANPGQ